MSKENPRAYLTVYMDNDKKTSSVIFKGNEENKGKFYAVKVTKEGAEGSPAEYAFYPVEYVKAEKETDEDTYIPDYSEDAALKDVSHKTFATKDDIRWFTIGNFKKDSGEEVGKQGIYSGGHIYKLDFSKGLTWKGENETEKGEFSPDVDGGTEEPQVTQIVDILATVKVLDWTEGNYTTEVN